MKYLITFIVAASLGFAAAYLTVTKPTPPPAPAAVTEETPPATNEPVVAPVVAKSVLPQYTATDILQKLVRLDPNATKDPARTVRQIIWHLESLTGAGSEAVHPISAFIVTGADVDYVLQGNQTAGGQFWNWRPGAPILGGLVLPPTLRLSLVDVLKNIGGEDAETALGVMLTTSVRPVEVAYISVALEKMVPGRYKEVEIAAAKKLLDDPAHADSKNPLDAYADANLYGVLNLNGDKSLVEACQAKLFSNGRFDADAAKYLVGALKEQAMPLLANAYPNANPEDKNKINNLAFNYVGSSPEANGILKSWLLDNTVDAATQTVYAKPRSAYVEMLAGGKSSLFQAPVPNDPTLIANRINFLNDVNASLPPSQLKQVVVRTIEQLNALAAGPAK